MKRIKECEGGWETRKKMDRMKPKVTANLCSSDCVLIKWCVKHRNKFVKVFLNCTDLKKQKNNKDKR